jgi:uncharacterized protein (DUF342 family)
METDIDNPIPTSMDELQEQLETTESNLSQLQSMITSENEKLHKYKVNNKLLICISLIISFDFVKGRKHQTETQLHSTDHGNAENPR